MVKRRDSKASGFTKRGSSRRPAEKTPPLINIWGIAGRQEIMEMRRLWQLRIPRRTGHILADLPLDFYTSAVLCWFWDGRTQARTPAAARGAPEGYRGDRDPSLHVRPDPRYDSPANPGVLQPTGPFLGRLPAHPPHAHGRPPYRRPADPSRRILHPSLHGAKRGLLRRCLRHEEHW